MTWCILFRDLKLKENKNSLCKNWICSNIPSYIASLYRFHKTSRKIIHFWSKFNMAIRSISVSMGMSTSKLTALGVKSNLKTAATSSWKIKKRFGCVCGLVKTSVHISLKNYAGEKVTAATYFMTEIEACETKCRHFEHIASISGFIGRTLRWASNVKFSIGWFFSVVLRKF